MKVKYSSNNSGGSWWLTDSDWQKLEQAGWTVEWEKNSTNKLFRIGDRFLGALATGAEKEFETPGEAMREFESITGADVCDEGCGCCGPPHSFSWGEGTRYGSAEGVSCAEYLFARHDGPKTLREAYELLEKKERE